MQGLQNISDIFKNGFESVLEGISSLFVPNGANLKSNFDDLVTTANKKLPFIFTLPSFMLALFTPISSDWFEAVSFNFMDVQANFNNTARPLTDIYIPVFRDIIRLLLWLTLIMKCYKRVVVGSAITDGGDTT